MLKIIELPKAAQNWPLPSKSIFLQENDAKVLLWLASQTSGSIIEIGCNIGTTTKQIAETFQNRHVIGVDWSGQPTMHEGQLDEQPSFAHLGKEARHLKNVSIINCDSRKLDYGKLGVIGLVFIDGDHTYEGVRADTELALAISPQPIIAWHDVSEGHPHWVGVLRYLNELSERREVIRFRDTWVACLMNSA